MAGSQPLASLLRMLTLLAVSSTCSAFMVSHAGSMSAASAPLATSAQRICAPLLKRSAEERDVLELEGSRCLTRMSAAHIALFFCLPTDRCPSSNDRNRHRGDARC